MSLPKVSMVLFTALLACLGLLFPSAELGDDKTPSNTLIVDVDLGKLTIDKNIYGHFSEHLGACIYGGYWVGEDSPIPNTRGIRNDVVEALKKIEIPILRWPGGCFADEYHWKDGIGPKDKRPPMINTHWGRVIENNHFGTHEFLDLCEQLGCEPYICGNVGSGTVREMQEWIDTVSPTPYAALVYVGRRLVGWACVAPMDRHWKGARVGAFIRKDERRKGYGKLAMNSVLDFVKGLPVVPDERKPE